MTMNLRSWVGSLASFVRLSIIAVTPLLCGFIVFLEVVDLTEKLMPFSPDDPFIWSWIKGVGPAGIASVLVYGATKRILAKLGFRE